MSRKLFIYSLFLLIINSACSYALLRNKRNGHHWGYGRSNGPRHWGGKCSSGSYQSPVNILYNNTMETSFEPLSFGEFYHSYLKFEAVNNGHTLSITTVDSKKIPTLQGGGLKGKYAFQGLHFHWGSEHQIDGERAALEMHLVHYNSKYEDIGIASLEKDGLAVVAVLCDESSDSDTELEDLIESSINAISKENLSAVTNTDKLPNENFRDDGKDKKYEILCKLRDLLPSDIKQWFRYEGSLTTPGCDETVTWTIILNRVHISSETLYSLRKLRGKDGHALLQNYRPTQHLNGRIIYLNVDEEENELHSKKEILLRNTSLAPFCNSLLLFFFIAIQHCYSCFKQRCLFMCPNMLRDTAVGDAERLE